MFIRSRIERPGGSEVTIGGTLYKFSPLPADVDPARPHVAEVKNEDHLARFLSVPEAYKIYSEAALAALPEPQPPAVEPVQPPKEPVSATTTDEPEGENQPVELAKDPMQSTQEPSGEEPAQDLASAADEGATMSAPSPVEVEENTADSDDATGHDAMQRVLADPDNASKDDAVLAFEFLEERSPRSNASLKKIVEKVVASATEAGYVASEEDDEEGA